MKEAVSFRFVGYHDHMRVGNWGVKGDSMESAWAHMSIPVPTGLITLGALLNPFSVSDLSLLK